MFNSTIIDLVLLLSFTYFIGSLVLSAINEAIAGSLRLRQKDLKQGLCNFFFDPAWRSFITHNLLQSPHIQSLMRRQNALPAYIPAKNWVLAILANYDAAAYARGELVANTIQPQQPGIPGAPDGGAPAHVLPPFPTPVLPPQAVLAFQGLWQQVRHLPEAERTPAFEKELEVYYNNAMDRVTGWYKYRIRKILLVLAILLSVLLNLDTVRIVNNALNDPNRLSAAAAQIAAGINNLNRLNVAIEVNRDSLTVTDTGHNTAEEVNKLLLVYKQNTGYSLGYNDTDDFFSQWSGGQFWKKLLGVLITAFALQLGSNYWFDLMNKAVNIRAAGIKPPTTPKT